MIWFIFGGDGTKLKIPSEINPPLVMRLSWEKAALMKYFELHVSFVIKTANFTANYLIITIISIQALASHKQKIQKVQ